MRSVRKTNISAPPLEDIPKNDQMQPKQPNSPLFTYMNGDQTTRKDAEQQSWAGTLHTRKKKY